MKRLNSLLAILIGLIFLTCSSDENNSSNENEELIRLYKKSLGYKNGDLIFDKTINYNANNYIESIIENQYEIEGYTTSYTKTTTVTYSENVVSTIHTLYDLGNNGYLISNYSVTIFDDKIILTFEDSSLASSIEIYYTNEFVDSTRSINETDYGTTSIVEQIFFRDINLNLISSSNENLSANNDNKTTYTYSEFDFDKMIDPFGSVTRYQYSEFFKILRLKVTNSNPTSASYYSESNNATGSYNLYLEYDNFGYVTKTTPYSSLDYIEHQYTDL